MSPLAIALLTAITTASATGWAGYHYRQDSPPPVVSSDPPPWAQSLQATLAQQSSDNLALRDALDAMAKRLEVSEALQSTEMQRLSNAVSGMVAEHASRKAAQAQLRNYAEEQYNKLTGKR